MGEPPRDQDVDGLRVRARVLRFSDVVGVEESRIRGQPVTVLRATDEGTDC